jgi:hypothetical protein
MAYAFFRQMPEGVPGVFRIMTNLVSIGKNPSQGESPVGRITQKSSTL